MKAGIGAWRLDWGLDGGIEAGIGDKRLESGLKTGIGAWRQGLGLGDLNWG